MSDETSLRVAFIAGSLGQGGAEKQLLYLARELRRADVDARVFALTCGDHYEPLFERAGVRVEWAGRHRLPWRAAELAGMVRRFRPHIVQAGHFFTNLYAVLAARACGSLEIGAIRNDTRFDMAECGRWGGPLLRAPRTLVANSREAASNAAAAGASARCVHVLENVIDLAEFDRARAGGHRQDSWGDDWRGAAHDAGEDERQASRDGRIASIREPVAIAVARLVPAKRLDRFLHALARVRRDGVRLRGRIVGDGPERAALEALARTLALSPDAVTFTGAREDVPRLVGAADMLVLTSQHEGFPNVLLEAMAARLPVITTPAGDAASLVQHGLTGFVVPFDDEAALAGRMAELARSPGMRREFGAAGRARVEAAYQPDRLVRRALEIYRRAAHQQHRATVLRAVETLAS